jgi:hypothetical protein
MVVANKVLLEYKLDPSSPLAEFIEWYGVARKSTNPVTGRKRKGNAKKAILEFIEGYLKGHSTKEVTDFNKSVEEFKEDSKLPKEYQVAKNTLSNEEYKTFITLCEKINAEDEKNNAA